MSNAVAASSVPASTSAAAPAAAAADLVPDDAVMSLDGDAAVVIPIKLVSKDGLEFLVDRKDASISTLVSKSLESDATAPDLPIPGVKGDILKKLVEYMTHHKGTEPPIIEKPLRSKVMSELCKDPWDAAFIDKIAEDRQQLYDVVLAANYADIKSLLHLGVAKVASLVKGEPLDKIKDILAPKK